jgi:hypothetical protein
MCTDPGEGLRRRVETVNGAGVALDEVVVERDAYADAQVIVGRAREYADSLEDASAKINQVRIVKKYP